MIRTGFRMESEIIRTFRLHLNYTSDVLCGIICKKSYRIVCGLITHFSCAIENTKVSYMLSVMQLSHCQLLYVYNGKLVTFYSVSMDETYKFKLQHTNTDFNTKNVAGSEIYPRFFFLIMTEIPEWFSDYSQTVSLSKLYFIKIHFNDLDDILNIYVFQTCFPCNKPIEIPKHLHYTSVITVSSIFPNLGDISTLWHKNSFFLNC